MATYGDIVKAIEELDSEQRESILLSLVLGLSLAGDAFTMTKLNNDIARDEGDDSDRTEKDMGQAFREASKRARSTFRHVKDMVGVE